jgi:proline iminopeptidase
VPLPIPAPREAGYTRTTTVPLYWAAYGLVGAPRLLVLHGGPGADHRYLLPQMLRLGEQYDLLFYDQRGGGQSPVDARRPVTWQTQVEDLGALIDEFRLVRPGVVGYSWGGLLAMIYATQSLGAPTSRMPGRLALIDPAPVAPGYRAAFEAEFARRGNSEYVQLERAALSASALRTTDPAAYRQRAFELSVAGYFADPRMAANLTPFRVAGRVQESVWKSLHDFQLIPGLQHVRAQIGLPALVVHGREDPIPLASSAAAAEALGADLVIIEQCGHVPYIENPVPLFAALDGFLSPLRAATSMPNVRDSSAQTPRPATEPATRP